ncbi:O-antigen ligase family protein [Flavobacterium sp.]|jgi:hypothetical protein|uniref:O-antigen ligase family protein n=1 Tax=Flavobacterium sp. TaxID=239 RepID=UPI0037C04F5A
MKNNYKIIYLFLLIPFSLELINYDLFTFRIDGFPYSLGMTLFVLIGLINIEVSKLFSNTIFKIYFSISFLTLIGCFFSVEFNNSIFRVLGWIVILIGAYGVSRLLFIKQIFKLINIFIILMYLNWILYIILNTIRSSNIISYSESFSDENSVLNHHIPGIHLTFAATYIIYNYGFVKRKFNLLGIFLILITFISCMLLESRSNLLFFILIILLSYFISNKKKLSFSILALVISFIFIQLTSNLENINQRFNITDLEYQENTNKGRIELYSVFFEKLINYPLGSGPIDIYLKLADQSILMHNQFFTFIIMGGVLIVIPLFFLFKSIKKSFSTIVKILNKAESKNSIYLLGLIMSIILFYSTLFTIELFGGSLFVFVLVFHFFLFDLLRKYKY